jgi:hypothetical protein
MEAGTNLTVQQHGGTVFWRLRKRGEKGGASISDSRAPGDSREFLLLEKGIVTKAQSSDSCSVFASL